MSPYCKHDTYPTLGGVARYGYLMSDIKGWFSLARKHTA